MEIGIGNECEPMLWNALAWEKGFAWEFAEDFGEGIVEEIVDGGIGFGSSHGYDGWSRGKNMRRAKLIDDEDLEILRL